MGEVNTENHIHEKYRMIYKGHLILFLNPDHTICCRGCPSQTDLPLNMKNPLLLPTKHKFTEFWSWRDTMQYIIKTPETLAAVREKYWILRTVYM